MADQLTVCPTINVFLLRISVLFICNLKTFEGEFLLFPAKRNKKTVFDLSGKLSDLNWILMLRPFRYKATNRTTNHLISAVENEYHGLYSIASSASTISWRQNIYLRNDSLQCTYTGRSKPVNKEIITLVVAMHPMNI